MNLSILLEILGLSGLSFKETLWVVFGTAGQLVFFSRWIIQWISSEKNKTSLIPEAFWWLSLIINKYTNFKVVYDRAFEVFLIF